MLGNKLQWTQFVGWTLEVPYVFPEGTYKLINCYDETTLAPLADASYVADSNQRFVLRDTEFSIHAPRRILIRNLDPVTVENLQILRYPLPISGENTLELFSTVDGTGTAVQLDLPSGLPQCSAVYCRAELAVDAYYEAWLQPGNGSIITLPPINIGETYYVRRWFRGVL